MKTFFIVLLWFSMISCQTGPQKFDANVTVEKLKQQNVVVDSNFSNRNISNPLIVEVSDKGEILLKNQASKESFSNANQLQARLKELLYIRSDKTVFVKAPKSYSYEKLTELIDAVKGAGAEPVGLQIDDLKE